MRHSILRDIPGEKIYDLTSLVDKEEEISVGRDNGNLIIVGEGISDERTVETCLGTVSRQHATITYSDSGEFRIKDHSTNGTRINKSTIKAEPGFLRNGDEIFFVAYGPVVYEEILVN